MVVFCGGIGPFVQWLLSESLFFSFCFALFAENFNDYTGGRGHHDAELQK